jgi:hypothetical protein
LWLVVFADRGQGFDAPVGKTPNAATSSRARVPRPSGNIGKPDSVVAGKGLGKGR